MRGRRVEIPIEVSSVSVDGVVTLRVKRTDGEHFASVDASPEIVDLVKFDVDEKSVRVHIPGSYQTQNQIKIEVRLSRVDRVSANGCSEVTLVGFDSPNLTLRCDGTSKIRAIGSCMELDALAEGVSKIDASELSIGRHAKLRAEGVSEIRYQKGSHWTDTETSGISKIKGC